MTFISGYIQLEILPARRPNAVARDVILDGAEEVFTKARKRPAKGCMATLMGGGQHGDEIIVTS